MLIFGALLTFASLMFQHFSLNETERALVGTWAYEDHPQAVFVSKRDGSFDWKSGSSGGGFTRWWITGETLHFEFKSVRSLYSVCLRFISGLPLKKSQQVTQQYRIEKSDDGSFLIHYGESTRRLIPVDD